MTIKEDKFENLIERIKREVQYKKSLAIRKTQIETDNEYVKKNVIVLKIGDALHDKISEDTEKLNMSRQKIIENILFKHYRVLRRN